jgi:hypothetical protein
MVTPDSEPFAAEETVGDFILPPEHFFIAAAARIFFDDVLVGFERGFILA